MGSSKSTQKTELPEWYEDAAKLAIERANQIYELGRTPYTGVDVVAVNPYEQSASRNVGSMASAFGLDAPAELDMGGMPTVTSGGVTGYSSYPMYIADMERLKEQRPDQYEYFAKMTGFDPITGASTRPAEPVDGAAPVAAAAPVQGGGGGGGGESTAEALERHYSLFPETRPSVGPYAKVGKPSGRLDTKGQIGDYASPSHGMSVADRIGADLGYAAGKIKKDVGGLFSGLKSALGG